MTNAVLKNLKAKPFGGASYVQDSKTMAELSLAMPLVTMWLQDPDLSDKFLMDYRQWINSSRINQVQGLEGFDHVVQTNGTTESFDRFYMANHARRFRCFRGEYMYHQAAWRNFWPNWKSIEDEPLSGNDAVVISLPFSDSGGKHSRHDEILERCTALQIPVLLDCAYFGICGSVDFDFSWPCITTVTFALSKTFPVSHARIGIRFTRRDDDDPGFVMQKTNYVNRISAGLGSWFMTRYSPDYIFQTYRQTQLDFCKLLDVEPTSCVIFGLGDEKWKEYNRGNSKNRLSFHKHLPIGRIPE